MLLLLNNLPFRFGFEFDVIARAGMVFLRLNERIIDRELNEQALPFSHIHFASFRFDLCLLVVGCFAIRDRLDTFNISNNNNNHKMEKLLFVSIKGSSSRFLSDLSRRKNLSIWLRNSFWKIAGNMIVLRNFFTWYETDGWESFR